MKKQPKALLINPPVYDFALYDLFSKPYGLLRVANYLKLAGFDITFVDGMAVSDTESIRALGIPKRKTNGTGKFFRQPVKLPEVLKESIGEASMRRYARYGILGTSLEDKIGRGNPDIVFLGTGMTYWYPGVAEAAGLVRKLHPGVPLIVGGIYATLMPEHCARVTAADVVFEGSDPGRFGEILSRYGFPSLSDRISFPGPLLKEDYWQGSGVLRLTEGCPFRCSYCASHRLYPGFTRNPPEGAFEQLLKLYSYGIRSFAFYDDALLFDKEKTLLPFLDRVITSSIVPDFYLPNAVHVRYIDSEAAFLMKKGRFTEVRLGFESASEVFHSSNDSKFDLETFGGAVENLRSAGFSGQQTGVYILSGLPGQPAEEVESSVKYISSFGIKIYIAEYSPVPGTQMWKKSIESCSLPLQEEPLFHNNTFFPLKWEKFTREDRERIKIRVKEYNRSLLKF